MTGAIMSAMAQFMIRFLICNLFLSGVLGLFFLIKKLSGSFLTGRMQYLLWFFPLGLLAVPFLSFRPAGFFKAVSTAISKMFSMTISRVYSMALSWLASLKGFSMAESSDFSDLADGPLPSQAVNQINDFTLSVSSRTPSAIGLLLFFLWLAGMAAVVLLMIKSFFCLRAIKKSALPLQNEEIRALYDNCLREMKITASIPIYSTAFLNSPVITGLFRPSIFLPIHLIADFDVTDIRYMLLHELQHYKSKDALVNYLINLAGIFYWFNPFVRYMLSEMRNDREIACDASVLKTLGKSDYESYGQTLISFAEKISLSSFLFFTGSGGSIRQLRKRIVHIASYQKPSAKKRLPGTVIFVLTAVILSDFVPMLSACAADANRYQWDSTPKTIRQADLSAHFEGYEGSFVLYDRKKDCWSIYNMDGASTRKAPDSTYKIYDALFALEEGIISPESSLLSWNGAAYPFEAWNADQTLQSAIASSVNWYFQALDARLGKSALASYISKINYGNQDISGELSSYWMESSLKISPIEQTELLISMYDNSFGFSPENIRTVKDALCLSSSADGAVYGKTGTGSVDGRNVSGWFIGFVETPGNTSFFTVNIGAEEDASGSRAAEIAFSILSELNIMEETAFTTTSP